jgi:hypothetical protein
MKRGQALHLSPYVKAGGDEGARTPDLGIANAALSQLSYIPGLDGSSGKTLRFDGHRIYDMLRCCQAIVMNVTSLKLSNKNIKGEDPWQKSTLFFS